MRTHFNFVLVCTSRTNLQFKTVLRSIRLLKRLLLRAGLLLLVWAFTLPFVSSEIYAQEIPYCGWYEKHGSGIFNFEGNSDGFYDRFGNHYSTWELQVPSTGLWQGLLPQSNHCDCQTEFNLNISPFALRFEDLLNGGTGVGFDDGANGVIARRTMCEVFVELSGLIEPTSNPCGEEDPVVRIKIGRSDEDLSEGGGALGLSSPFIYSRYFEGEMADGMPWLLINGGNDATSAIGSGLFHGQIWINFFGNAPGFDGWNFSHQSLPNGNKHDLFTVCRHEALHVLGFASFINTLNPVTGAPVFNNYHRYDTHLELTTGNSLIQNGPYDLDFNQNISSAAFDQDCQAAGASVQFVTANNSLDIFTVPSSNINRASMFSHFCGGGATNLLMSPTLEANERRSINSSYEEAVLRALGYKINIGDCNVAGVDDIGPACTNNVFSGDLCLSDNDPSNDQVDITFSVEDLIGNDGEGVDGIAFLELNVGSGQLTNNGDGTYTFSSALPGISVLRYIPTSSSCNKAGNVTRVTISIDVCEGECAFVENGGLTTIDDGFNRNPCNLICNPEFSYMFNNPNTNNDEKLPIGCGGLPGAQAPGVEKATESPDVYFNSFIPYVDLVNGARKHVAYMQIDFDNGEVVVEESIHIPVTIEPESNYLISGFHSCFGNTAEMEMHFASINDLISDQFCPFEKTLVSDVEAYPSGYKEVFKSDYENIANNPNDINWTKFATCFEFNGEFEGTSLWIYPQFVPGSSTTQEGGVISFLDQLELIEDNFDAGQPISISCNQTITIGGDEFCMLSDMAVEYSWYEASDVTFSNPLLSYTLEREYDGTLLIDGQPGSTIPTVQVSPTVNTSYILRRIYIPDPNTEYPTPDFVFCKDTDDLHVEVIGSYDPGFVIYACDYDIIATAVETDQSLDYNWTISDGTTLTGQSISHTVSGDGSYSITLSVGIEGVCQSTSFFPSITLPANCTSFCCPVGATSISDTYVSFGGLSSNIDYCLSGTLIVDDDFVYSGSMSIEPNAKIIVKSGNTLELTGAKLDGCTALWEGISVEGGARLIMSNSEIRDAKTAIFAMRHSYLDITKSNFLQNHIGIQLQPRVEVAPFFDNLFDGSTPLLPALGNDPEIGQSAYSGIISETEKLFIGVEGEGVNEFSFLRNGILSSSQILSVVNSNFSDIRFDSSEPYSIMGYGIFDRHNLYCGSNTSNVTFDDCDFGIYSYGSPGDEIRVTNNTMSNVSTGVSVNKFRYGNIYLIQNEIRATHTGIALLDNNQLNQLAVNSNLIHLTSTGIFGIEVEELGIGQQNAKIIGNEVNLSGISNGIFIRGAQGYELWNNHVKFINGDPGLGIALRAAHHTLLNDNLVEGTSSNTDAIGIDVYSSASVMFDCNTIRNMGVGVSFKGACAGIFEPTLLSTTNFVAPIVTGLRYRDNLDVDQQIHRGNKWDTNNGLFGFAAMNEVSEPDFQISLTSQLFEVHQTALPFYPSSIAFPNATGIVGTDWFQPALGIPAQCAGFINDQLGTVKAEMVARGDGYASQYGTTLLWEARRKLFNTIYSTPDSTYSTPVDSFYNASYTGLIKAFQDYEDSRLDFLQYERERFSGIVGKLNGFRDSVLLFNQSLAKGDTLVTAIRGAYLASIDNLLSDLAREESIYNYRAMNHFSSLEGAIHELHTSTSYETALKQIWRGHARLQQTGRDSFPTNWLSTLENLAESCPLEGGNAIFLARSLYKILEGGHITGGCLGNNAFAIPDPGTGVIANTISIKAFPNPAKSSLTIEFEIPEQGLLRLFDVNGKLVRSESLLRGQGQRFWDISALPSGVLWLQIQSQRKSEIIKVVVLK